MAQTAAVNGVVTDSSQAVVAGATVTITNLETGLRRDTRTNDSGAYSLTLLPVGRYKVEASLAGFSPQTRPQLNLDVDQSVRLDFALKPGAVTETIEVSAAAALLRFSIWGRRWVPLWV